MSRAYALGIIGTGKMGSALLKGVLGAGLLKATAVLAYDVHAPALKALRTQYRVNVASSVAEVLQSSQRLLLAVKPQDLEPILRMAKLLRPKTQTVISICAGIPMAKIKAAFATKVQICRAMPNTPAVLLSAASAVAFNRNVTTVEQKWLLKFFGSVGYVCEVKEARLNAITGLSGSGPAYAYYIMEALAQAGVAQGIAYPAALGLAAQTMAGAAKMILMNQKPVAQLIADVTSKGGTTFAGMDVLSQSDINKILKQTVAAATARAAELASA